ncbi:hypothetical protein KFL_000310510 [Klebsormidium nitens]|uniref:Uncharacterized protein n=1 Tax=Klebsormidium nitens TaxID=105231 RepID=A0A1Y1HR92_KLENI|nr:hypothetical protein KFL_000310510 [Klebsormidium nitens]|eukprot:GAQ79501.1 hypothetical protein KFL_000310510 [Klebsormidium nitens]
MLPSPLCVRLLVLVILCGCRLMGEVRSATMEEIGNLVKGPLWNQSKIDLGYKGLNGTIPPELGRLTNLTYLKLGSLTYLTKLYLFENNLSGPIPVKLGSLAYLTRLSLSNNRLSGPIPPELGSLTSLSNLALSNNNLSGPIPPELSQLTLLKELKLFKNSLSGPIPSQLSYLTRLITLALGSNTLSGPIPPQLGGLTSLQTLLLNGNILWGPIPPQLGNLTSLQVLYLDSNKFSLIPPQLSTLSELQILSLRNNYLSGLIPGQLGNLTSLQFLDLSNNRLLGPIPLELSKLAKLEGLYLSSNKLSGPIPPQLGNLTKLAYLQLNNNDLSGSIPLELGNLADLSDLDLSFNDLLHLIPPQLGSLTKLAYLSLNHNDLRGAIPLQLGQLSLLSSLDLSSTYLSGPIPPQLGSLVGLGTLNLSFTDTTCERLDLSHFRFLTTLGLTCPLPSSFKNTNVTYVALSIGNSFTKDLDLSSVPNSCKIVNLTGSHPHLDSIQFWGGCDEGCIVNLAGTGATLPRSTRRRVCLGRISIFLNGDIPYPVYDLSNATNPFTNTLKNARGTVYDLMDPNFVDNIDLGPEGRAYTGVGFSRVQAGNLCGNPEAKKVTALVFGVFASAVLLATIPIVVVARWRRRTRGSGLKEVDAGQIHGWRRGGLFLWGAALGVLPVVDIVTDFLVLSEVYGAWPMWVILASVCAPFVVGAYMVAKSWVSTRSPVRGWKGVRVRWLWPLPELGISGAVEGNQDSVFSGLVTILLLPVGLLGVLVQDLLSVAERFGLHLAWGGRDHRLRALPRGSGTD